MSLADRFEALDDVEDGNQFLKFENVVNPPSKRADLVAFLLLDKLVPGTRDIIGASEHDEIFLDVDVDLLDAAATDEDLLTLYRCGVGYDHETDSLRMFT